MIVAGIDGFRKRWLAVVLESGRFSEAVVYETLAEASELLLDTAVIAVDVPIGYPSGYGREADRQARDFVGPRRSSIFMTYPQCPRG